MSDQHPQASLQVVWQVMTDRYQRRWTSSLGSQWDPMTKPWILDCGMLTKEEFKVGLKEDETRFAAILAEGKTPFPPSSLEFRAMATKYRNRSSGISQHAREMEIEHCHYEISGVKCPRYASIDHQWCRFHSSPEDRTHTSENQSTFEQLQTQPQSLPAAWMARKDAVLAAHQRSDNWRNILGARNPMLDDLRQPLRVVPRETNVRRLPGKKKPDDGPG